MDSLIKLPAHKASAYAEMVMAEILKYRTAVENAAVLQIKSQWKPSLASKLQKAVTGSCKEPTEQYFRSLVAKTFYEQRKQWPCADFEKTYVIAQKIKRACDLSLELTDDSSSDLYMNATDADVLKQTLVKMKEAIHPLLSNQVSMTGVLEVAMLTIRR